MRESALSRADHFNSAKVVSFSKRTRRPSSEGERRHVDRNSHFGLPDPIQCTRGRHPSVLQIALLLKNPWSLNQDVEGIAPGRQIAGPDVEKDREIATRKGTGYRRG